MDELSLLCFKLSDTCNLRYVTLTDFSTEDLSPKCASGILFIGIDVIRAASPKTLSKHYCRYNEKLVKQGYASKVNVKGLKIQGISHASNIWMYNILGVFKIAFDNDQIEMQHYLFMHFSDLWLSTYDHAVLPPRMTIHYKSTSVHTKHIPQNDIPSSCNGINEISVNHKHECISSGYEHSNSGDVKTSGHMYMTESEGDIDNVEIGSECVVSSVIYESVDSSEESTYNCGSNIMLPSSSNQTDCASNVNSQTPNSQNAKSFNIVPNADYTFTDIEVEEQINQNDQYILTLETLVKMLYRHNATDIEQRVAHQIFQFLSLSEALPLKIKHIFKLFQDFIRFLVENDTDGQFVNDFGISAEKNRFLCFISEWFGKELLTFRDIIMNKSECFKQRHISCIDNLPPSKDVVNDIFPQCMVALFLSWMNKDVYSGTNEDNCPSPPKKMAKSKEGLRFKHSEDLYPFIQLILEFANNCLLSGVAHVVYPRLLNTK